MRAPWCIALLLALVPLPLAAQAVPVAAPLVVRQSPWLAADPLPARPAATRMLQESAPPSLRRSLGWSALTGASAGLVMGLAVLRVCDSYCEGQEAIGVATMTGASAGLVTGLGVLWMCDSDCDGGKAASVGLHVGVGAVAGAAAGGLLYWIRR